jgi:hypothetical protein
MDYFHSVATNYRIPIIISRSFSAMPNDERDDRFGKNDGFEAKSHEIIPKYQN